MVTLDYKDLVMQLHDIARTLEQDKKYWVFGNDLRKLADRLNQVGKQNSVTLTEYEMFVSNYVNATNAMTLENQYE